MRLREPMLPDWLAATLGYSVLLLASPAILAIAALVGVIWLKRKAIGPTEDWGRWFAWYPVRVDFADTRWLEMVERRSWGIAQDTQYRASGHELEN